MPLSSNHQQQLLQHQQQQQQQQHRRHFAERVTRAGKKGESPNRRKVQMEPRSVFSLSPSKPSEGETGRNTRSSWRSPPILLPPHLAVGRGGGAIMKQWWWFASNNGKGGKEFFLFPVTTHEGERVNPLYSFSSYCLRMGDGRVARERSNQGVRASGRQGV